MTAAAYRKFLQQARPEYGEQVAHARDRLAALEASHREPVQRAAEARRLPGSH